MCCSVLDVFSGLHFFVVLLLFLFVGLFLILFHFLFLLFTNLLLGLIEVTDEQAYWHGCATCRWELKQHQKFHDDAIKTLDNEEDRQIQKASHARTSRQTRLYVV
jgi:hypothetical protein